MRVVTVLGTRPEIIRTSRITPLLDKYCDHTIIHTNQNFTHNLKDLFFEELGLRQPDYTLTSKMKEGWGTSSHSSYGLGGQLADMFPQIEELFNQLKPDKVFILGDTNSALCTIIAERMGIPVAHMESSNRSFNRAIPEEVNRRLIDSIASYNLFYTDTNRHTLLREGCDPKKIFQCGNPTLEVLTYYKKQIYNSDILDKLELKYKGYFLADIHRSENVNDIGRLTSITSALNSLSDHYNQKVICSIHPKTKDKLRGCGVVISPNVIFLDAFGFFDFVKLEQNARVGITDSGLCSEEYNILGVPCVIARNETERPEVVETGGAIISGVTEQGILDAVKIMDGRHGWAIPQGYEFLNVSQKVVNYILGKCQ